MVTRNIRKLGELGCKIDLDDFGSGHTSIASIRRFSVSRIKIDRSFVIKSDRDPEQQRMISAILSLAERLDVQTLAEGVETAGEHALLAQLGCDHVQGFGMFDHQIGTTRHGSGFSKGGLDLFGNPIGVENCPVGAVMRNNLYLFRRDRTQIVANILIELFVVDDNSVE